MATRGDSEGFCVNTPRKKGARHKDSHFPMSDENASEVTDAEFKRLKADFLKIVELWLNQIKTQFDLHQITDNDERYR